MRLVTDQILHKLPAASYCGHLKMIQFAHYSLYLGNNRGGGMGQEVQKFSGWKGLGQGWDKAKRSVMMWHERIYQSTLYTRNHTKEYHQ